MDYTMFFDDSISLLKELAKCKLDYEHLKEQMIFQYDLLSNFGDHSTCKNFYISHAQLWRGKIIERIFAIRKKKDKYYFEEVIRKIEGYKSFLVRNIYYTYINGYNVCYTFSNPSPYCFLKDDFNRWFICHNLKLFDIHVNAYLFCYDYLVSLDTRLKYCCYKFNCSLHKFISLYRKFPQIEFLSKFDLIRFLDSGDFLVKLNDKDFINYLIKNKKHHLMSEIAPRFLLSCYKKNMSLSEYEKILLKKRDLNSNPSFEDVVKKYNSFMLKNNDYSLLLPNCKADLVKEGNYLHHCVGKLNYDKKIINGSSLILFLRKSNDINKPLYTIEYSLVTNSISQFYGEHNSLPDNNAKYFIYNEFLPYFNNCVAGV